MVISLRPRTRLQQAFCSTNDDLGRRVVNGAVVTFIGIAFRTIITIGSMALLARLLKPGDFGQLAMATVVAEFAAVFSNFGFGSILVQKIRISRIQLDTMHWCAVGLGLFLTVLVFVLSFFASYFFQDEMAGSLLRVLCLSFILEELSMVSRSLLIRTMRFRLDSYIQICTLLVRAVTAISMAYNGMGVWSLVGGSFAGWLVQTCAYQALAGYWPRARFSTSFLKSTWRTNGSYFGNGILFYINSNLDYILIGRIFGASMLGQYQNARSLTEEIRVRMVQPIQRILFPAFSAIQNDEGRFRDGILRSSRLLALIFIPVGVGIAAVAPELVVVLYGEQWLPMIPILQVISISAGYIAAGSVGSPIFNATNRVGLSFRFYLIQTLFSIAFLLFGSQWGLMGVAWSRLAYVSVDLIFFRIALGFVKMNTRHMLQILGSPSIAAFSMWWLLGIVREWLGTWVSSDAARMGYLMGVGILSYVLISLLISKKHLADVKEVVSKLRRKAGG